MLYNIAIQSIEEACGMMKRKLAAVCLLGILLLPGAKEQTRVVSQSISQSGAQEPDDTQDAQALFPELSDEAITSIRIAAADDCEFIFNISQKNGLSVNGQKADGEVFSTLVDQLLSLSFTPIDPFEPSSDPVLTLTVYTDDQDFTAQFYQDNDTRKYAYIITGEKSDHYLKTDAWRVGTLLLTCEGTRIFDASGQETPVE